MTDTIIEPRSGAALNRHRSKQDYSTPQNFINAVETKFGKLSFDLAADWGNTKCGPSFFNRHQDSLKQCWSSKSGLLWLNPPFDNIAPWAEKCMMESLAGAAILFLTPASIGSNWFADYVNSHAMVYALRPRLSFDGKNPYPKDCILSCYGAGGRNSGFECWKWK